MQGIQDALDADGATLEAILSKAVAAYRAAEAARKARELVRRKSVLTKSALPGKLADCSSTDAATSEIFIVEGDSAGTPHQPCLAFHLCLATSWCCSQQMTGDRTKHLPLMMICTQVGIRRDVKLALCNMHSALMLPSKGEMPPPRDLSGDQPHAVDCPLSHACTRCASPHVTQNFGGTAHLIEPALGSPS